MYYRVFPFRTAFARVARYESGEISKNRKHVGELSNPQTINSTPKNLHSAHVSVRNSPLS